MFSCDTYVLYVAIAYLDSAWLDVYIELRVMNIPCFEYETTCAISSKCSSVIPGSSVTMI